MVLSDLRFGLLGFGDFGILDVFELGFGIVNPGFGFGGTGGLLVLRVGLVFEWV